MQILLYVMTILMTLAALTYAQINFFKNSSLLKTAYTAYIDHIERATLNRINQEWYESVVINSHDGKSTAPQQSTSRLNINLLVNLVAMQNQPEEHLKTKNLLRQLMVEMYKEEKFFQEMLDDRPNFISEILEEIERNVKNLPEEKKIKKVGELAKLTFNDRKLQYIFYLMLHGIPKKPIKEEVVESQEGKENLTDEYSEKEEAHAEGGFTSLLDKLTIKATTSKIRVFLASRELLNAIYEDPYAVESILKLRKELYQQLLKDKSLKDELTKQFEKEVSFKGKSGAYQSLLDFTVSGTNPKNYE